MIKKAFTNLYSNVIVYPLVALFVLLGWYDYYVLGYESKVGMRYHYRTQNEIRYVKPAGLVNLFSPWVVIKENPLNVIDTDINSMYTTIVSKY